MDILCKIDYRLSSHAHSRAPHQLESIIKKLRFYRKGKYSNLLDIGGGTEVQYKKELSIITNKYHNLEISKAKNVDIVGSVYKLPIESNSYDLVTLFMVLEHLNEPIMALKDCFRVLKNGGYLVITTVQYWHTHNYPDDFYRYTKQGLEYLCKKAGLKIVDIWSLGGPFLVLFHMIEINLNDFPRVLFSICFYRLADWLDWVYFKHNDHRKNSDSVGWTLIATK